MRERGRLLEAVFSHVQRHSRVRTQSVPEHVVVLDLALRRDLRGFGLQLLEADDVGPVAREPVTELRLARANAVDVPSADLQEENYRGCWAVFAPHTAQYSSPRRSTLNCTTSSGSTPYTLRALSSGAWPSRR